MTQSDAEQLKSEEDVTHYHGQLLEQLRHVEDNINKFAIQNYAASGAVVLAYLADKAPLWAAIIIVALLNINFAIAICVQAARVHKLFTMHCIVRNFWLDNRPELLRRLQANRISNEVLATTTLPRWVAIVILLAQFLPILFLLLVAPFNEYMAYYVTPGFWSFCSKVAVGWLGAWIGSPVIGHWPGRIPALHYGDVWFIPAILGAAGVLHLIRHQFGGLRDPALRPQL